MPCSEIKFPLQKERLRPANLSVLAKTNDHLFVLGELSKLTYGGHFGSNGIVLRANLFHQIEEAIELLLSVLLLSQKNVANRRARERH